MTGALGAVREAVEGFKEGRLPEAASPGPAGPGMGRGMGAGMGRGRRASMGRGRAWV